MNDADALLETLQSDQLATFPDHICTYVLGDLRTLKQPNVSFVVIQTVKTDSAYLHYYVSDDSRQLHALATVWNRSSDYEAMRKGLQDLKIHRVIGTQKSYGYVANLLRLLLLRNYAACTI